MPCGTSGGGATIKFSNLPQCGEALSGVVMWSFDVATQDPI